MFFCIDAITNVGRVRPTNEDRVAVDFWSTSESMERPVRFQRVSDTPVACLVADGMGGHSRGALASKLAVEFVSTDIVTASSVEAVSDLLRSANFRLFENMTDDSIGMGTTIAGIRIEGGSLIGFNVGDSRIYTLIDDEFAQASIDDVPIVKGRRQFGSSLITQALGGSTVRRSITPHTFEMSVSLGDKFLLCTDGITCAVKDSEISEALNKKKGEDIVHLFNLAMSRGAVDNMSLVIISAI